MWYDEGDETMIVRQWCIYSGQIEKKNYEMNEK